MKLFAISDLHLSLFKSKEMDVFGKNWKNHWGQITKDWNERVSDEDVVLICGDISWAMHYREAKPDLDAICSMPGYKLMLRGNHDYWHSSLTKTRAMLSNKADFIQNNAIRLGDYVFAGTRGWKQWEDGFSDEDKKIYTREVSRMKLSLESAAKLGGRLIVLTHYPPFDANKNETDMTRAIAEYSPERVVYGHVHGHAFKHNDFSDFKMNGATYSLTSCDYLNFRLREFV